MKKVKAIFRGENGSLGLQTGMEYELMISYPEKSSKIIITITGVLCEYGSVIKFLQNWDCIRAI